nr:AAA+ ATPase domain-containing protein [Tanacetum cinerariifolium]
MWRDIQFEHPSTFAYIPNPLSENDIVNDLMLFKKSRDYYKRIEMLWKRKYLLYGPPGIGKSNMIAAMANPLKYDIYDIKLNSVKSNMELRMLMVQTSSQSLIVLEDVDCSLDLTGKRKEKKQSKSDQEDKDIIAIKDKKKKRNNKTPQEAWNGMKPTVSHLRIFGSIAYLHVSSQRRSKLDDRKMWSSKKRYHGIGALMSMKGMTFFLRLTKKSEMNQVKKSNNLKVQLQIQLQPNTRLQVQELTTFPKNQKAIGVKWVYKAKKNAKSKVEKYKARLVEKDYKQKHGINYEEVFALVARLETIRMIIPIAAQYRWKIHQMDVKSAFLNGFLEEEV